MNMNGVAAAITVNDRSNNPENVTGKLREYPPSVKLVFKALEQNGTMTLTGIERETYLPYRTVRYAVKRLKEGGLVTRIFHIQDARQSLYRLAE
jgi:DNA-binding MarR family transcriptional regulator